jgi:hypothetical protein
MKKQTLFWAAILFIIQISNAQTITVKGKVTDSGDNNALIGVSVRVSQVTPAPLQTLTEILLCRLIKTTNWSFHILDTTNSPLPLTVELK